jgi:hypothetical protein
VASHGLIDPLNQRSSGTAYFWPFSSTRFTWGDFQPIPTTPVGLALLHRAGFAHLVTEVLLFSPLLLYAFWPRRRTAAVALRDEMVPVDRRRASVGRRLAAQAERLERPAQAPVEEPPATSPG